MSCMRMRKTGLHSLALAAVVAIIAGLPRPAAASDGGVCDPMSGDIIPGFCGGPTPTAGDGFGAPRSPLFICEPADGDFFRIFCRQLPPAVTPRPIPFNDLPPNPYRKGR